MYIYLMNKEVKAVVETPVGTSQQMSGPTETNNKRQESNNVIVSTKLHDFVHNLGCYFIRDSVVLLRSVVLTVLRTSID